MKNLVVYSSLTGNTRMIAEAIHAVMPKGTEIAPIKQAPDPAAYDFIAIGFWVDKGMPDKASQTYMERVRGKKVGIFGTLGAYPDSEHARDTMKKAADLLPDCELMGDFICQGKVDPKLLAAMAKMTNNPHPNNPEREARLAEAARHPNAEDCAKAQAAFKNIVARLAGN